MTFGLAALMFAIALILLILSAVPPMPYSGALARVGLAFLAAGLLVGSVGA